jgi:hypothetical protein
MATPLTVPRPKIVMAECTLAEWLVADCAQVNEGGAIYCSKLARLHWRSQRPCPRLVQRAQAGVTYEVGTDIGEIV